MYCNLFGNKPYHTIPYHTIPRIRCKLDQTAVVWNISLTFKKISDLERVQKSAVRIICGKKYDIT